MAMLVANCPRCGSEQMTFDVTAQVYRYREYDWQNWYEVFSICRNCKKPTIFLIGLTEYVARNIFYKDSGIINFDDSLNPFFKIKRFISLRDNVNRKPPEHVPEEIANAFSEGAACLAIGCHNAAGTMFRLCLDLTTRPLLPDPADSTGPQPNSRQRRDLGFRLPWLIDNGILPESLRELAKCVREDGNDGAHQGTLTEVDAEDLADFTEAMLERLYTEPERLKLAEARRAARRKADAT